MNLYTTVAVTSTGEEIHCRVIALGIFQAVTLTAESIYDGKPEHFLAEVTEARRDIADINWSDLGELRNLVSDVTEPQVITRWTII